MMMSSLPSVVHCRAVLGLLATTLLTALVPTAQAADRFVVIAGGAEIQDTSTGLIWRRCAEGQGWNGSTCTGSPMKMTWEQALAHAQATAASSGTAWRLPNVKELSSLVDRSRVNPAMNTTAFPGASSDWYWSSTHPGNASLAMRVNFASGHNDSNYIKNRYYAVRLMRAGQ